MATEILPLEVWPSQITQASVPANNNALRVEVLNRPAIAIQNAQPAAPQESELYILGSSPTGAQWSNFSADNVVIFKGGTWLEFETYLGLIKSIDGEPYIYSSSGWSEIKTSENGSNDAIDSITIVFDAGVDGEISVDSQTDIFVPYGCTIKAYTMLAVGPGSITVNVWKNTFENFPPNASDSICASNRPTITEGIKSQDLTLSGWSTSVIAGDTIRANVDSCAGISRVSLTLTVERT